MNRLLALALAATAAFSAPATAQSEPGDRVNTVIIYGEDECPVSTADTITVCARLDESERYRIPPRLRQSGSPENESWNERFRSLEAVGAFGPVSCSATGAGAELGCTLEMIEAAYAERAASSEIRFAELIAEERAERLAEIDAEAADTQARVEELEAAELERRRAAQGAPLPGESSSALPEVVDPEAIPEGPPSF